MNDGYRLHMTEEYSEQKISKMLDGLIDTWEEVQAVQRKLIEYEKPLPDPPAPIVNVRILADFVHEKTRREQALLDTTQLKNELEGKTRREIRGDSFGDQTDTPREHPDLVHLSGEERRLPSEKVRDYPRAGLGPALGASQLTFRGGQGLASSSRLPNDFPSAPRAVVQNATSERARA
jgi:hypothetical protein